MSNRPHREVLFRTQQFICLINDTQTICYNFIPHKQYYIWVDPVCQVHCVHIYKVNTVARFMH